MVLWSGKGGCPNKYSSPPLGVGIIRKSCWNRLDCGIYVAWSCVNACVASKPFSMFVMLKKIHVLTMCSSNDTFLYTQHGICF
jgi:hypothetical protein